MSYIDTIEARPDLKPGMSGGPLINLSDASLIGVNAGRFALTRKPASVFMPVENIHELIAARVRRSLVLVRCGDCFDRIQASFARIRQTRSMVITSMVPMLSYFIQKAFQLGHVCHVDANKRQ